MGSDDSALSQEAAVRALLWWMEAGVGFTLAEEPFDAFATPTGAAELYARRAPTPVDPPPSSPLPPARPAAPILTAAPAQAVAADLAASAQDLHGLRAALERFDGCALKKTATQLVFSDGVPGSRVMFVGEGPGGDEDKVGRPFVGRAGQLLDRMLNAIGLDRGQVYIANVVPWRPPGNRTPTPEETLVCLPFIRRQIELAAPEILVCLGAHSAQTLLGLKTGITRARGSWRPYASDGGWVIQALAMLHPAFLLRQPTQKRAAWADMRALAAALAGSPARR